MWILILAFITFFVIAGVTYWLIKKDEERVLGRKLKPGFDPLLPDERFSLRDGARLETSLGNSEYAGTYAGARLLGFDSAAIMATLGALLGTRLILGLVLLALLMCAGLGVLAWFTWSSHPWWSFTIWTGCFVCALAAVYEIRTWWEEVRELIGQSPSPLVVVVLGTGLLYSVYQLVAVALPLLFLMSDNSGA